MRTTKVIAVLIVIAVLTNIYWFKRYSDSTRVRNQNPPLEVTREAKDGIEINIYHAELTKVKERSSAPLAGGVEVSLPSNSCIEFKHIDPVSLHDTLFAGCNSERDKPLLHIAEVAHGGKSMNVFGEYDYTDCSLGIEECVVNMIINRIEPIN